MTYLVSLAYLLALIGIRHLVHRDTSGSEKSLSQSLQCVRRDEKCFTGPSQIAPESVGECFSVRKRRRCSFCVELYAGECTGAAAADKTDQHDRDLDNGKEGSDPEVSWLL